MSRALRHAARALLVAGAMGLAGSAIAQQPNPTVAPPQLTAMEAIREGRGRLEEMKVELAWHADRSTFSCPLNARVIDGELEVRGAVPSEVVLSNAVKLAQAHTHLPVRSNLRIDRDAALPEIAVSASALRQGAVEVLTDSFGASARSFEINAEADGLITIGGSVNSVEEKLMVSRRLQQVRGCTHVANYLLVSPQMRNGKMVTAINAGGTLVVSGQLICLDGAGQDSARGLEPMPNAPATVRTRSPQHAYVERHMAVVSPEVQSRATKQPPALLSAYPLVKQTRPPVLVSTMQSPVLANSTKNPATIAKKTAADVDLLTAPNVPTTWTAVPANSAGTPRRTNTANGQF
ncbi:MAG: hypothetical protein ACRD36_09325, partial [Candidatus Acidiferrum sp.]